MSEVVLSDHRSEWADEFERISSDLRDALGSRALRIDHIGSTSVPGLAAKDVVDLQVIVERLDLDLVQLLEARGFFSPYEGVLVDHVPATWEGPAEAWQKLFLRPSSGRRVHVHIRVAGSPNARYALLFRDYLRASPEARDAWAETKRQVAREHPDRDAYAEAKDPLTDVLMDDAERWAARVGWSPPA